MPPTAHPHQGWPTGPGVPPSARPAIPAGPFQVICYWLLWGMALGLPVIVIGIRSVTQTFGWFALAYLMFGIFGNVVVQGLLAAMASASAKAWTPRAIGTRAGVASLVYYASWAGLALSLRDFGDSGPSAPSWVEEVIGRQGADAMVWVFLVLGAVSLVATFALIIIDGDAAARRAWGTPRPGGPGRKA